jgi:hypothetical protein
MMMDSRSGGQGYCGRRRAEIEGFLEGFKQPSWRGMRINGERVPVWQSGQGWSGL